MQFNNRTIIVLYFFFVFVFLFCFREVSSIIILIGKAVENLLEGLNISVQENIITFNVSDLITRTFVCIIRAVIMS